jgi:hypothetical protein
LVLMYYLDKPQSPVVSLSRCMAQENINDYKRMPLMHLCEMWTLGDDGFVNTHLL